MLKRRIRGWSGIVIAGLALLVMSGCPPENQLEEREIFSPWDMSRFEFDGQPEIEAPDRLLFQNMLVGQHETRQAEIANIGRAGLELEDFLVEGPFELAFPEYLDAPPSRLSPGQTLLIEVAYTALSEDPVRGKLIVVSDDPKNPEHEIALLANVDLPCVNVQPATRLRFGGVDRQASAERHITVTNCSETLAAEVNLEAFEGDSGFRLSDPDDRGGVARRLEVGESALIPVSFRPQEIRDYVGSVTVVSEDELQPRVTLALEGTGLPPECPLAVIAATSTEGPSLAAPVGTLQGKPLETVNFDAAQSQAFGGSEIVAYEWALVLRPQDTVVELSHYDNQQTNELYLELAGSYEVELHVVDSEGTRSCEPARMRVESVSGSGLHVQLVWDTPNDPSRHDNSGADMDLHLLRGSNGTWNRSPGDCYWLNMNPDWGDPGNEAMNPSLDIDKIHGWGPENINLLEPENGETYSVGVYYFADHGYGASYATVRVFIDGDLRLELLGRYMTNIQFWHVADVDWPTQEITIFDSITAGFPN